MASQFRWTSKSVEWLGIQERMERKKETMNERKEFEEGDPY